jgi:hypothetical protein
MFTFDTVPRRHAILLPDNYHSEINEVTILLKAQDLLTFDNTRGPLAAAGKPPYLGVRDP